MQSRLLLVISSFVVASSTHRCVSSFVVRPTASSLVAARSGHHLSTRADRIPSSASASASFQAATGKQDLPTTKLPVAGMRGVKKENLPTKICVTCGRPFNWRKKWERVWDEVTTCSKSCNRKRKEANRQANQSSKGGEPLPQELYVTAGDGNMQQSSGSSTPIAGSEQQHDGDSDIAAVAIAVANEMEASLQLHSRSGDIPDDDNSSVVDAPLSDVLESLQNEVNDDNGGIGENDSDDNEDAEPLDPVAQKKAQRKAAKKAKKAARRAQREGRGAADVGQKTCDMCGKSVNLLVRCMYEQGQTDWRMICGKCWNVASGGIVDGDANHPHYRYGGLWKNRRKQT